VRSKKPGVDEHHTVACGANAFRKVDAGAPFFVHDADFQGIWFEAQQFFDAGEQFIGKRHLFGSVHFWLDDVDGSRIANCAVPRAAQVVQGNERSHRRIDEGLGNGSAVQHHGIGHHVMATCAPA